MRITVASSPGVLVVLLTKESHREDDVETRSKDDVTVIVLVEYETTAEMDFIVAVSPSLLMTVLFTTGLSVVWLTTTNTLILVKI